MNPIEDGALFAELERILKRFEARILAGLEGSPNLGFVEDEDPALFVSKVFEAGCRENPLTAYLLDSAHPLPPGNFLMPFVRGKDFGSWETFTRHGKWPGQIPKAKMREYADECLAYLEARIPSTAEPEASFLRAFAKALRRPGTSERF